LVKFVWNRLVQAPCPSVLVCVVYHSLDYLLDSDMNGSSNKERNSVEILISVPFDVRFLSKHFTYLGRDIATPYLSCLNLKDPVNDCRLLGNTVYSPGINRYNLWSFRDFFTGAEDLGFYRLDDSQFGINHRYFWEEYYLSRYVDIGYYVVDFLSQKRISEIFDDYEEAERFAISLYYGKQSKVKGLRFVPGGYFLTLKVVSSCIRKISHPIGFFSYVKTNTGIIYASELLSFFRKVLACGGEIID